MLARISGVLTCGLLMLALAQPNFARGKGSRAASGKGTTVTGCLAKGDEANEYSIKGDDGKTYGLYSSKVNLSEHVGHKVTVTGSPTREKEKAGKAEAKTGMPEESSHLNVSNLKMVSTSCQ